MVVSSFYQNINHALRMNYYVLKPAGAKQRKVLPMKSKLFKNVSSNLYEVTTLRPTPACIS